MRKLPKQRLWDWVRHLAVLPSCSRATPTVNAAQRQVLLAVEGEPMPEGRECAAGHLARLGDAVEGPVRGKVSAARALLTLPRAPARHARGKVCHAERRSRPVDRPLNGIGGLPLLFDAVLASTRTPIATRADRDALRDRRASQGLLTSIVGVTRSP
jgi:hypothetical protein